VLVILITDLFEVLIFDQNVQMPSIVDVMGSLGGVSRDRDCPWDKASSYQLLCEEQGEDVTILHHTTERCT
jgi:hypothetical protein